GRCYRNYATQNRVLPNRKYSHRLRPIVDTNLAAPVHRGEILRRLEFLTELALARCLLGCRAWEPVNLSILLTARSEKSARSIRATYSSRSRKSSCRIRRR